MYKFVCLFAALAAAPALAAPAATPQTFNGPFIGGELGWQYDHSNLTLVAPPAVNTDSQNKSGLSYGAYAGYDLRVAPQAVIGAEVGIAGATGATILADLSGGTTTARLTQGRTIDLSARAGYLVSDNGLLYARAGYTNAAYKLGDGSIVSGNRDGYLLGLGYEQMLAPAVSARIEYDYSHFGSQDQTALAQTLTGTSGTLSSDRHAVKLGVSYRF